jgi:hypothetical protein
MHACVGDQIRVRGHHIGQPDRTGEILEVRGADGGPPVVVRWDDSDHAVLFFPGNDAVIEGPGHSHRTDAGSVSR